MVYFNDSIMPLVLLYVCTVCVYSDYCGDLLLGRKRGYIYGCPPFLSLHFVEFFISTVRTILNRQRWNAGFSIITEANTNGGMRVSASASKNVRSIVIYYNVFDVEVENVWQQIPGKLNATSIQKL